jgi:hypothetical protein
MGGVTSKPAFAMAGKKPNTFAKPSFGLPMKKAQPAFSSASESRN